MLTNEVCIYQVKKIVYPKQAPFRPDNVHPESPFKVVSDEPNVVYEMVRNALFLSGLDKDNFGTAEWNPLKSIVKPGQTVLLKPNLVMHKNPSGFGIDCLVTHPSVIAAVLDYVVIALDGKGKIIVGDAPVQGCDFNALVQENGLRETIEFYKSRLPKDVSIELVDFRGLINNLDKDSERIIITDEKGVLVDLSNDSEFCGLSDEKYRGMRITNYDPAILAEHHNKTKNEYLINSRVLSADVVINMPKPKCHRKAGVTISLKNFVGTCARKEYLPHHINGSPVEGGDCYLHKSTLKRLQNFWLDKHNYFLRTKRNLFLSKVTYLMVRFTRLLEKIFGDKDGYFEGNWYGNNTISKTVIDLNKILLYADKDGHMCNSVQRKQFIIADMIVAGEKEGPLEPSPKFAGIIAVGADPVYFDMVIATLMGADVQKIPTLTCALNYKGPYQFSLAKSEPLIVSNIGSLNGRTIRNISKDDILNFQPAFGWTPVFQTPKN